MGKAEGWDAVVMISVVLADDDGLVRAGLALLLAAEPDIEVVADVPDGVLALSEIERLRPNVAVVDLRMPMLDGVGVTRAVVGSYPQVGVLALTTFAVEELVYEVLRAGASGFILKDAAPAELGRAVRAVALGEGWLDPAVTRQLIAEFARRPANDRPAPSALAALTARERYVLELIAHGMSNEELATRLGVAPATVKTHINRIFGKLELRDRGQAVGLAYRTGLVAPGDAVPE